MRIAVIPSRGGSKRIPFKSLEEFGSTTLLGRKIQLIVGLGIFDYVIVSTDSELIAVEAEKNGALVPNLRSEFNDEYSPVSLATLHSVLEFSKKNYLEPQSKIFQFMPNCPFVQEESIVKFSHQFDTNKPDALLSSVKADPINRFLFEYDAKGNPVRLFEDTLRDSRTQDFLPMYVPSGAIWATTLESLRFYKTFYAGNYRYFELTYIEGFDIDTFEQLEIARLLEIGMRKV